MENFTPVGALVGGALIGLSATLLMALIGRLAGITGILTGAAMARGDERQWRIPFIVGLIAAPALYGLVSGGAPAFVLEASPPLIILAGLLVGFGARLGSGCTSGHGVCGLARMSPRSFVSVAVFMSVAIATSAIVNAVVGG